MSQVRVKRRGAVMAWLHRLGSPKTFFEMTGAWSPRLGVLSVVLLLAGAVWALGFAPQDYQQGHSVRIMYIHVPAAMLAQSGYAAMAAASAVYLVWRIRLADLAARCVAPLGASMTFLALATGAIWGRPTWGAWWEWGDARLMSTLVLGFLYLGVMALRAALGGSGGGGEARAGRACALLTLVGVVNLPIIKYSVDWWYTLHQPASFSLTSKPAMPAEMWLPLAWMAVAFHVFFAAAWIMRIRSGILVRERRTDWVGRQVAAS